MLIRLDFTCKRSGDSGSSYRLHKKASKQKCYLSISTVKHPFKCFLFSIVSHSVFFRYNHFRKVQVEGCCEGWKGASCSEPVCANACVHGKCIAPSTCACDSEHAGEACQYSKSEYRLDTRCTLLQNNSF
jgi:hypothetical protein